MQYISRKNKREEIQRQQDHWNEVHGQLIEVQKKSLAISDPQDNDEKKRMLLHVKSPVGSQQKFAAPVE